MKTKRNFEFQIWPKKQKEVLLLNTLNTCQIVYNRILETRKNAWENEKKSLSRYDCNKLIREWNIESDKKIHSQVLQNVSTRVDLAFQGFFKRLKVLGPKKAGYPRFKSEERYKSFCYPGSGFQIKENKLILSKIGTIKINFHRKIRGEIKTCTIKRESNGKWFVVFSCDIKNINLKRKRKVIKTRAVGIDLGCKTFATLSDGKTIDHPHYYKQSEKKLKEINQKHFKLRNKPKDDKKKQKVKSQLSKLHTKIKNQRKDFLHKLSRKLTKKYSHICVEKLSIQDMLKNENGSWRNLNKSIQDSGWFAFKKMMEYKAGEAGIAFIEVDPFRTSQICSTCGTIVKKELKDRVHKCPVCKLKMDRDLNAALNILRLGLQSQGKNPRSSFREVGE